MTLTNREELKIDKEDIQCILNLPRGDVDITESIGQNSDGDKYLQMLRAWRIRWAGSDIKGSPTTVLITDRIIENKDADDDFNRDFVVYVVSSFLWTAQNAQ